MNQQLNADQKAPARTVLPAGARCTFSTPYDQYRIHDGKPCNIVAAITAPDETHDVECLPMYQVRFDGGTQIEAWPQEIAAGPEGESRVFFGPFPTPFAAIASVAEQHGLTQTVKDFVWASLVAWGDPDTEDLDELLGEIAGAPLHIVIKQDPVGGYVACPDQ